MSDGLAISAYGMDFDARRLGIIAQNVANSTTTGFKKAILVSRPFADYLGIETRATGGAAAAVPASAPDMATVTDFTQGTQRYTGNPLDLTIEGPGFFELRQGDRVVYSRQGNFQLDLGGRLVNHAGLTVSGTSGDITLTSAQPVIDAQGRVTEAGKDAGQVKVVRIANPQTLEGLGDGLYAATDKTQVRGGRAQVRQGFLEASNVATMQEMVRMIETMRHFEASQKVVQAYDGILDKAISKLGDF